MAEIVQDTESTVSGKQLVPKLVVGCFGFGILMSLLCWGIWMGTKDFFIEQARRSGRPPIPETRSLAPESKDGNRMFSPK